jgi:hypothetical protein
MQAQHTDSRSVVRHTAAYGQPPGYELPPGPPSLPYVPLPQRRGTGSTILLVLVALAIPGLIVGILALGGGDSTGDDMAGSEGTSTDDDGGTDDNGTDDESELTGPSIDGVGYAYAIPEGWEDSTRWAHDVASDDADSAVSVSQPDHGFDTNVLVASWDADGVSSVDEAREAWLPDGGSVEDLEPTSIDGAAAIGVRNETLSDGGRPIVQVGYLTLWNDRLYSVVLSVPVQSEADSQAAFAAVLDSWSWADVDSPDATTT